MPILTQKTDSSPRLAPLMPYILVIGGVIGLICSFIISYDKLKIVEDPAFVPGCTLNPVISCGSVMRSWQGSVFGFPNPWIGLAGFSILITVGMAMLAGGRFKRWFWACFELGMVLGLGFAYWLLGQSVYRIKALCPYCLTVDAVMTIMFWYATLYVIREGHLPLPRRLIGVADFARRYHLEILVIWILLLTALILQHFWYFYGQYI